MQPIKILLLRLFIIASYFHACTGQDDTTIPPTVETRSELSTEWNNTRTTVPMIDETTSAADISTEVIEDVESIFGMTNATSSDFPDATTTSSDNYSILEDVESILAQNVETTTNILKDYTANFPTIFMGKEYTQQTDQTTKEETTNDVTEQPKKADVWTMLNLKPEPTTEVPKTDVVTKIVVTNIEEKTTTSEMTATDSTIVQNGAAVNSFTIPETTLAVGNKDDLTTTLVEKTTTPEMATTDSTIAKNGGAINGFTIPEISLDIENKDDLTTTLLEKTTTSEMATTDSTIAQNGGAINSFTIPEISFSVENKDASTTNADLTTTLMDKTTTLEMTTTDSTIGQSGGVANSFPITETSISVKSEDGSTVTTLGGETTTPEVNITDSTTTMQTMEVSENDVTSKIPVALANLDETNADLTTDLVEETTTSKIGTTDGTTVTESATTDQQSLHPVKEKKWRKLDLVETMLFTSAQSENDQTKTTSFDETTNSETKTTPTTILDQFTTVTYIQPIETEPTTMINVQNNGKMLLNNLAIQQGGEAELTTKSNIPEMETTETSTSVVNEETPTETTTSLTTAETSKFESDVQNKLQESETTTKLSSDQTSTMMETLSTNKDFITETIPIESTPLIIDLQTSIINILNIGEEQLFETTSTTFEPTTTRSTAKLPVYEATISPTLPGAEITKNNEDDFKTTNGGEETTTVFMKAAGFIENNVDTTLLTMTNEEITETSQVTKTVTDLYSEINNNKLSEDTNSNSSLTSDDLVTEFVIKESDYEAATISSSLANVDVDDNSLKSANGSSGSDELKIDLFDAMTEKQTTLYQEANEETTISDDFENFNGLQTKINSEVSANTEAGDVTTTEQVDDKNLYKKILDILVTEKNDYDLTYQRKEYNDTGRMLGLLENQTERVVTTSVPSSTSGTGEMNIEDFFNSDEDFDYVIDDELQDLDSGDKTVESGVVSTTETSRGFPTIVTEAVMDNDLNSNDMIFITSGFRNDLDKYNVWINFTCNIYVNDTKFKLGSNARMTSKREDDQKIRVAITWESLKKSDANFKQVNNVSLFILPEGEMFSVDSVLFSVKSPEYEFSATSATNLKINPTKVGELLKLDEYVLQSENGDFMMEIYKLNVLFVYEPRGDEPKAPTEKLFLGKHMLIEIIGISCGCLILLIVLFVYIYKRHRSNVLKISVD